ncbi:MAG: hypothetical protein JXJ17_19630 [Anaerolineae bacterium]|nr:hypothetical protein [Anaerolineae bacterium]
MSSPDYSNQPHDLGKLVETYPLNKRGILIDSLFFMAVGIALIVFNRFIAHLLTGLFSGSLYDLAIIAGLALIMAVGSGFALVRTLRLKSLRALFDPPPELHASAFSAIFLVFILPPLLITFFAPRVGIAFAGIEIVLAMLASLIRVRRHRGQAVEEYAQGIVVPVDGQPVAIRWEEISAVWAHGHIGRYEGPPVKIKRLWQNPDHLLARINQRVSERLYTEKLKQYNAGITATFGRVLLDRQGLAVGRRRIPWSKIDHILINANHVSIRHGVRTRTLRGVSVSEIPDLACFLSLTTHILTTGQTEIAPVPLKATDTTPVKTSVEFRPALAKLAVILGWLAFAIFLVVIDLLGVIEYSAGSPHYIIFSVGAIMAVVALYRLVAWLRSAGVWVRITEDSLTYSRAGQTAVIEWKDVESVQSFYVSVWMVVLMHRCTLISKDEQVIHLRQGMNQIASLIDHVYRLVGIVRSPVTEQRIKDNHLVRFSRWGLSKQGIHDRDRILPWDQVKEVVVRPHAILVKDKSSVKSWTRIPLMGTPNMCVFLTLVGGLVKYELPSFRAG